MSAGNITYSGKVLKENTSLIRNAALAGILNRFLSQKPNLINAAQVAAERGLAHISHHLTVEARNRPAITSLRLLAVLNVLSEYASLIQWGSSSGARLVLTCLSRTSPRHLVRKAD